MNQLIRCISCDAIFLKTPFDQWQEYESGLNDSPESLKTIERDDFQDFLRNHRGHRLEKLRVLEDSFVSEKDYLEPVKTSYFKATNGKENFVVKKFREKIDEPLRYQLIHGDYSLRCVRIEIQSEEIEKQLKAELKTRPLPQKKLCEFLKLFQYIVNTIDIKKLERISWESPNPLQVYYKMDDISLVYLLRNCRNIFNGQEYSAIEDFIHRHKDDGVLLLKATYSLQVTEIAKQKKAALPALAPVKVRKVIEKREP